MRTAITIAIYLVLSQVANGQECVGGVCTTGGRVFGHMRASAPMFRQFRTARPLPIVQHYQYRAALPPVMVSQWHAPAVSYQQSRARYRSPIRRGTCVNGVCR